MARHRNSPHMAFWKIKGMLQQTLDEEKAADKKLEVAESKVNRQAV
jgi:hypothetical protein